MVDVDISKVVFDDKDQPTENEIIVEFSPARDLPADIIYALLVHAATFKITLNEAILFFLREVVSP